jgi:hypothetical protein
MLGGGAEMRVSLDQPTTSTRFLSTLSVTGKSPRGRLKVDVGRTEFATSVTLKNVDYIPV